MRVVIEGISGPGAGRTFSLRKDQVVTVGRTEWSDIAIESDAQISARHFTIENTGKVAILNDLKSTNGVRINGQDVQQVHLKDGDEIAAGLTTFVVRITDLAHQHTPLGTSPYPNAPKDPTAQQYPGSGPAAPYTPQSPLGTVGHGDYQQGPPPSAQAPPTNSPPGNFSSPISGSPISPSGDQRSAPPLPSRSQGQKPQSVGQSPIFFDPAASQTPAPSFPNHPNVQGPASSPLGGSYSPPPSGSGSSPIAYDAGSSPAPYSPATPFSPGPKDTPYSPIQNSPISSPPPPPSAPPKKSEDDRHIVLSKRQIVKSAGAGALQFVRVKTKSDRVIYKGKVDEKDEDREFAPSALMALLAGLGPYLLITHHQRAGLDVPEYSSKSSPLFDWMPPETARGYSPIVTEANLIEKPFNEIDELWDKDALIVVMVKDPEACQKHLIQLTKWNPFGVEQNTLFGYCWPKVLAQFLEHGNQEMADKTFGNSIVGFFFEDTAVPKNWQLLADAEFGKKLTQLGFEEIEEEKPNGPGGTA